MHQQPLGNKAADASDVDDADDEDDKDVDDENEADDNDASDAYDDDGDHDNDEDNKIYAIQRPIRDLPSISDIGGTRRCTWHKFVDAVQ